MPKKQARGMIIVTIMNGLVTALCQRRGKRMRAINGAVVKESYPGATRVTFHGGMEDEDSGSDLACLRREGKEEIGEQAWHAVECARSEWVAVGRNETEQRLDITYAVFIPDPDIADIIRWHSWSGGLEPVDAGSGASILDPAKREHGVQELWKVEMFADELAAVLAALEHFAHKAS